MSSSVETLSPGECALFVWTGDPGEFRFSSKRAGAIVFAKGEVPMLLRSLTSGSENKFGVSTRQSLQDTRGLEYELHLEDPVTTADSVIYRTGTLTLPSEDGWLRFETARGLSTCNPADIAFDLLGNKDSHTLRRPDWLERPNFKALRDAPEAVSVKTLPSAAPLPVYSSVATRSIPSKETLSAPPAVLIPAINVTPATRLERTNEPVFIHPPMRLDVVPDVIPEATPEANIDILEKAKLDNPPPLTQYEVQLGAYNEPRRTIQAWEEISSQASYLSDQLYRVEAVEVAPSRIAYRLRVMGFSKLSTAVQFCEKLKSDAVDCFAVKAE